MMSENKKEMQLPKVTLDDLFLSQEEREVSKFGERKMLDLGSICDFPNHPYKVKDDEKMQELVESVKKDGILFPVIVRPKKDGTYEMIAGHRRKRACQIANIDKIPCLIRDISDDEATILMVNSNIQREEVLPSEKAFAYKMKLEAEKRQGQRTDLTSDQVGWKLRNQETAEKIGKENGDSQTQVRRYIRLTELIKEMLDMVDEKKIAFNPAVELSYLKEEEQYILLDLMEYSDVTPSHSQAIRLKKLSQEGNLTEEKIEEIMGEIKSNQIEKFKINSNRLKDVLPKNIVGNKEIEDFIIKCIEDYNKRIKQQKSMER